MDTEIPMMQYQPSSNNTTQQHIVSTVTSNNNNNNNNDPNNTSSSSLLHNEMHVIRYAGRQAVCTFLQNYNCLSILKTSTKIVVFDIYTPIQLAFYALVEHDTLCAPLWDSKKCQFVGLLTVTDFIDLLYYYACIIHKDVTLLNTESIYDIIIFLQQQQLTITSTNNDTTTTTTTSSISNTITTPTTVTSSSNDGTIPMTTTSSSTTTVQSNNNTNSNNKMIFNLLRPFLGAGTSCTLYRACTQLLLSNHDFLPIVFLDDMRVLSCITYTTILEHLVTHFREQRRLFDDSVADLHIGTYGSNVISITTQHTLRDAIQLMSTHSLSALPVLDASTHKILAMYSRSDITFLTRAVDAEDAVRNLNLTLYDILNASNTNNTIPTTTTSSDPTTTPSSSSTPPITTSSNAGQTPPLGQNQQNQQSSLLHHHHQYITTPDALRTCQPTHTLQAIFESFAIQRFNRLCVIDENEHLLGIVSAKDLVAYFLSDTIPTTSSSSTS